MKTFEEIAIEIANRTDSITEIKCPRDVKNPGLYFGAMLALIELDKQNNNSFEQDKIVDN